MRGNGEAVADPVGTRLLEHQPIARRQVDHVRHLRPGEADAGQMAGPMNGIGGPKFLLIKILDPLQWIIVQPDRRLRRLANVDMVGEREIVKAHFPANGFEHPGQLGLGRHATHVTHERINPGEHPPPRPTRAIFEGRVPSRRRPKPPFFAPPLRVSTGAGDGPNNHRASAVLTASAKYIHLIKEL